MQATTYLVFKFLVIFHIQITICVSQANYKPTARASSNLPYTTVLVKNPFNVDLCDAR